MLLRDLVDMISLSVCGSGTQDHVFYGLSLRVLKSCERTILKLWIMEALSKCTHYGRCPFLQERFGPSFNKFRTREQSLGVVVVEERDK